jgi:hypothetical protein
VVQFCFLGAVGFGSGLWDVKIADCIFANVVVLMGEEITIDLSDWNSHHS